MSTPGSPNDTYADNAEFWVKIIREQLDRYRTELTDGAVLDAVGPCAGAQVLDGGCGEGYMSRLLARRGASVVGVDTSATLVAAARNHTDAHALQINYEVADLERLPAPDSTFDIAVCNHVLSDVTDPEAALRELGRVLRPGGRLVALMLHPCFYTAHAERDASGSIPVTTYFAERRVDQPFAVAGLESPTEVHMNFRPLEFYSRAVTEAGFLVSGLSEPHPPLEWIRDDPWWQNNFVKPLFLLISAELRS